MGLKEYPNLEGIMDGTITGEFRNWGAIKHELVKLIAEVEKLTIEAKNWEISLAAAVIERDNRLEEFRKALGAIKAYVIDWCLEKEPEITEIIDKALKGVKP